MFIIIGLMFSGVSLGYLLRRREMKWVGQVITALIWTLLFLLGVDVGGNREIISGLHTIGVDALAITVAAVLGSAAGAMLLWNWIRRRNTGKGEQ